MHISLQQTIRVDDCVVCSASSLPATSSSACTSACHTPPYSSQGILLTPASESVLGGALGTDVFNTGGVVALTAGVAFQLYVASVNYARNAPEGYNAVKDVRVSVVGCLKRFIVKRLGAMCVCWGERDCRLSTNVGRGLQRTPGFVSSA